jgi:hypothetical protein
VASKRHLRKKACEGKQRLTEEQAIREASAMNMSSIQKWNAYHCEFNGGNHWHIGHLTHRSKLYDQSTISKHQLRQRR